VSNKIVDLGTEPDEITRRVDRMQRRQWLRCAFCPPNRGENRKHRAAHGTRKPRYKDHRGRGAA
jgi:hypothetical protein